MSKGEGCWLYELSYSADTTIIPLLRTWWWGKCVWWEVVMHVTADWTSDACDASGMARALFRCSPPGPPTSFGGHALESVGYIKP